LKQYRKNRTTYPGYWVVSRKAVRMVVSYRMEIVVCTKWFEIEQYDVWLSLPSDVHELIVKWWCNLKGWITSNYIYIKSL